MTTFHGHGAAAGTAVGPPLIITNEGYPDDAPRGAILVAGVVHPYLAPLFSRIGGVVVEDGGLLQHAAILAREFGIPAVVGIEGARARLAGSGMITVDGTSGVVTAAEVEPTGGHSVDGLGPNQK